MLIPSSSTSHISRSSRTVKFSVKAQEVKNITNQEYLSLIEQSSEIEMHKLFFPPMQSSEIEKRESLSLTEHESSEIKKRKPLCLTEHESLKIEKRKSLSPMECIKKIENFIISLIILLDNWEESPSVSIVTQLKEDFTPKKEEDSIRILATKINLANAINYNQFTSLTQFDVEKSKTYFRVI